MTAVRTALPPAIKTLLRAGKAERGVTLLEVLIAILIISFGMLGMAGMQSVGMKFNLGAAQRTAATLLANDMADRMRANAAGVTAGSYNSLFSGGTAVANCGNVTGCTTAELAQNDMYEWNQAIQAVLPGGQGFVCLDDSPADGTGYASLSAAGCPSVPPTNSAYVIKIWWDEERSVANPAKKQFWVTFRP
jgi:type IV pilus assembly protein PilV